MDSDKNALLERLRELRACIEKRNPEIRETLSTDPTAIPTENLSEEDRENIEKYNRMVAAVLKNENDLGGK